MLTLLGGASTLTGCSLSDDYYVDDSLGGVEQSSAGGATSSTTRKTTGGGSYGSTDDPSSTDGASSTGAGGATGDSSSLGAGATGGSSGAGGSGVAGSSTSSGGSGNGGGGVGGSGMATSSTSSGQICQDGCNTGRSCDGGSCESGWVSMSAPPAGFVARQRAAATAFDGKVFIFGGVDANGNLLDSGAVYDPRTDSWNMVTAGANTPTPREMATAVWTGSHVLVVGGLAGGFSGYQRDAALYDPLTDSWTSTDSVATARARSIGGLVDGGIVLVQGITTNGDTSVEPERYDLDSETWSLAGDPSDLSDNWSSAIVFSGQAVFVSGGNSSWGRSDRVYRYDVAQDTWNELPAALSERSGSFGVWDGANVYLFGGHDVDVYNDGAVYNAGSWDALLDSGAPSGRRAPPALSGWAFAVGAADFVVMGGVGGNDNLLIDGGRYRRDTGWEPIEPWPSNEYHSEGVGVWTGEEFVVWSGGPNDNSNPTLTGERWAP